MCSSLLMIISATQEFAAQILTHTISQHFREFYSIAYLPLYVFAKILPFAGIGLLSKNYVLRSFPYRFSLTFIISLLIGLSVALINDNIPFFLIMNDFLVLIIGFVLIFYRKTSMHIQVAIIIISGISIGYEDTLHIARGIEYRWLFITLFAAGIVIFLLISRTHFPLKDRTDLIRAISGTVFLIVGIFVILMT